MRLLSRNQEFRILKTTIIVGCVVLASHQLFSRRNYDSSLSDNDARIDDTDVLSNNQANDAKSKKFKEETKHFDCTEILEDIDECNAKSLINQMDQKNPELIEIIKNCLLVKPPTNQIKNLMPLEMIGGQIGQARIVDELYSHKWRGFYVEAGAYDGSALLSNTLLFEQHRKWSGVLIEPNQRHFTELRALGRNAYLLNACLSIERRPKIEMFDGARIVRKGEDGFNSSKLSCVQCLPTFSVLMALGNPTVELFSLDVEGKELSILRTIPLDKVKINLFLIEIFERDTSYATPVELLNATLGKHGYEMLTMVRNHDVGLDQDVIFVKKGLKLNLSILNSH